MKSEILYCFLICFNIALAFLLMFSLIAYEKEGFHPIINSQINKHKRQLNSALLVNLMRENIYNNEEVAVVVEQVNAMPGQGVTSMFNFGQSFGILKGICSAMQLPMYFVRPAKWKKYFSLINSEKDASRTKAIEMFTYFSSQLSKKKD